MATVVQSEANKSKATIRKVMDTSLIVCVINNLASYSFYRIVVPTSYKIGGTNARFIREYDNFTSK